MESAVVIDLQILNCVGMQACLQHFFPDMECLLVSSEQQLDNFAPNASVGLVILGLNQEHDRILTYLKEKSLAIAGPAPVIICYQNFDLQLIKSFRHYGGIGVVHKDNIQGALAQCIETVNLGRTYFCEDTSQYLITAFLETTKRKASRRYREAC